MCELQKVALNGVGNSFHQETLQILKRKRKTKQGRRRSNSSSTENEQDYESPGSGNWGSCQAFAANVI